ncbi:hypothetical protein QYF61_007455 [Mycteria americana]|uniref:Uncharacterized protein n=1 Tax=Mycteria americana TaxID=33587 RepID=A0AAN7NK28_MYCAM|nr:hypothetical protein QYF61_007455 [Mycteria americana]
MAFKGPFQPFYDSMIPKNTLQIYSKVTCSKVFRDSINTYWKTCLQYSEVPKTHAKVWSKEDLPLVENYQVRKHLNKMDIH